MTIAAVHPELDRDKSFEVLSKAGDLYIHTNLVRKQDGADGSLIVEGFASTRGIDEVGDIVEPGAFTDTLSDFLEFPNLFFMHDFRAPIGSVKRAEINDEGLLVRAEIVPTVLGADVIKLIRADALKAFSIGFLEEDSKFDEETRVNRIKKLRLLEVSVVTLPANREATFEIAKQLKAWHRHRVPRKSARKVDAGNGRSPDGQANEMAEAVAAAGASFYALLETVDVALSAASRISKQGD